jgi:hypothetical protein
MYKRGNMKRILLIALLVLGIGTTVVLTQDHSVLAAAKDDICGGVGAVSGGAGCAPTENSPSVDGLIKTIVTVLSWVVGVVSIIMIMIAGFQYVTSSGDSGKIGTAKSTLTYAIVGIVIVAFAQAIVQFVLGKI